MKVRELIRNLLEVENLDTPVRAINVNDNKDEFDTPGDPGFPLTSIVDLGDSNIALYFVGDKPSIPSDDV